MTNKRTRFTFRLPQELMEKMRLEAKEKGISANALMLTILWKWYKENNK